MNPITVGGRVRQATRAVGCSTWTVLCYLVWLPAALALVPFPRPARWWNSHGLRWWTRGLTTIMGVRVEVRGPVPARPFFLVANHVSYLDILVLGSRLGCTFISKHELAGWPVLGHLARVTGTIFVNREVKRDAVRVLDEIDRAIAEGAGVLLFPEGTSTRGDRVLPLRPALLEWAAQREHAVHAVLLGYRTLPPDPPADESVCWWGDAAFGPHLLGCLALRRVEARLIFLAEPAVERDRGRLAARLHGLLESALRK
jgi:1-acyl-sn-glycerol-3-phosphate acyltransferase